ncbi:MAG TPA: SRPBCC family protein [Dehalococcoidia bacterium]|nr:SRPBCC family protein [Dehalococcoidia bacterium]
MATNVDTELAQLVRETTEDFRVNTRVYSDPDIFELEMERIFERGWVFIAHESELPNGGDYKTTNIGRQPIIVTRNSDTNQVHVFFNRCRHRGTTVCQEEFGQSNFFRCAYHGWVYNSGGELVGVPKPEGYGKAFKQEELGLTPLPRIKNYKGFIFGSCSPEGESFEEHMGNALAYLDRFASLGPDGVSVAPGIHKGVYPGNWKLQLENTVDGYHFTTLHEGYMKIVSKRATNPSNYARLQDQTKTWDLGNGHAVLEIEPGGLHAKGDPRVPNMVLRHRLGQSGPGYNISVFPNVAFLFSQIRVIQPISVDKTEVTLYPIMLKGAEEAINKDLMWEHVDFYGPGGFAAPDDQEIFSRLQKGFKARGNEWALFLRGIEYEKAEADGSRWSGQQDESSQRAIHRQWKRLMTGA